MYHSNNTFQHLQEQKDKYVGRLLKLYGDGIWLVVPLL